MATFPNIPFNLTCAAVGPPEPVEVVWWLGGVQGGEPKPSPSVLHVPGQSKTPFKCVIGDFLQPVGRFHVSHSNSESFITQLELPHL